MGDGVVGIGITGILAAQLGMTTAGHNITNANTPGFNRQRTLQATTIPLSSGLGFIGQGVRVTSIERLYSAVLANQVSRSQSNVGELQAYDGQIQQLNNLLADADAGLSPALQDFFKGAQQVAADAASIPARQALLSSAQVLVARFSSVNTRLTEIANGVNSQISSSVTAVNAYAQQIAELNQRIVLAQGASGGQQPNDLLDQRDQQLSELNKLVGVTTTTSSDGNLNVFIGSGQQLVVGGVANSLVAMPSSADPQRITVGLQTANASQELAESLVTGGSLSGLLKFRSRSLDTATNQLGRIAASLTHTFNAQHALGQDLLGNIQGSANFEQDFFVMQPATPKIIANTSNAGTGAVTATFNAPSSNATNFYTNLTASDYRLDYDGVNYRVTRLSDNNVWTSATFPIALPTEGISIQLSAGVINSGDSFLIEPTRDVAGSLTLNSAIAADPRLVAAATPISTQVGASNSGTATITPGTVSTGYTAPAAGSPATFTYAAGNLDVSGLANGTVITVTSGGVSTPYTVAAGTASFVYNSGDTIAFNGISFKINGTPGAGDSYTVGANTNGVADSSNAVLLGKLLTQNTIAGATATYQSAYSQIVSATGNKAREIQVTQSAQQSLLEQSISDRDSLSGVNLDEEAANLMRYQQAYQASAKLIEMGAKIFEIVLSLGRQ